MATTHPRTPLLSEDAPAVDAFSITPNDDNDLTYDTRALYIGVGGAVAIETIDGNDVTFTNVAAGILPVRARKVLATGTTATGIIGLV